MSVNPDIIPLETAMQLFDDKAQLEYQNRQYLVGIGEDRSMMGTALDIPVVDTIELQERNFTSGDLPIANIDSRSVSILPREFSRKSAVGKANETLFAYDKVSTWSEAHIKAAARTIDSIKIDAILGGDYSLANNNLVEKNTAATPLSDSTGLSMTQLTEGETKLEENGYDIRSNIFLVGGARPIKNIFNDARFTSWDYKPNRPLSQDPIYQFDSLMGFSVRKLGKVGENVIPEEDNPEKSTAVYLIAGDAIVNGYNEYLNSSIVNEPSERRTLIVTGLTMGTAIIHNSGIIKIEVDAIPQPV